MNKGGLAGVQKPDVVTRKVKTIFAKSRENKLRDIFAYREDLVVQLSSLIPIYQSVSRDHPIYHPDSHLCDSCQSTLAHGLYWSPVRFQPYLAEHATRGYLGLVDDAVASLEMGLPMEIISHHELERICRGELAQIEWRITLKVTYVVPLQYITDICIADGSLSQDDRLHDSVPDQSGRIRGTNSQS